MCSELIQAMKLLKDIFNKYAGKEGDSKTLTKSELADLLRHELPSVGETSKSELDQFFKALDCDGDNVVNFTEYVTFAASLCVILNEP